MKIVYRIRFELKLGALALTRQSRNQVEVQDQSLKSIRLSILFIVHSHTSVIFTFTMQVILYLHYIADRVIVTGEFLM